MVFVARNRFGGLSPPDGEDGASSDGVDTVLYFLLRTADLGVCLPQTGRTVPLPTVLMLFGAHTRFWYAHQIFGFASPGRGRRACNFELGATLILLLQSIIPSDQHPVVHIGSYEVWQQAVQIKFTNL